MPSGEPAGGAKIKWDDTTEKHLLLAILANANPTNLNWDAIATSFGHSITASAASQKYGKIRRRDVKIFGANAGTPVKATKVTPNSAKRGRKTTTEDDDDDEEVGSPTPVAKKVKKITKKDETAEDGSPVKFEVDYGV